MGGRAIGRKWEKLALGKMLELLKACHEKVARVGGAVPRSALLMLRTYQRRRVGLVIARSSDGSCVAALCLKAVRELRGTHAEVEVREIMGTVGMIGIADMSKKVQEWGGSVELARLKGIGKDLYA